MKVFTFHGLPIPPSENRMYRNLYVAGRKGRCASHELLQFRKLMEGWYFQNKQSIEQVKNQVSNCYLGIEYEFRLRHEKIFCKDHSVKMMDTSNRIKGIQDEFCKLIGIDDKMIFDCFAKKRVAMPLEPEHTILKLIVLPSIV